MKLKINLLLTVLIVLASTFSQVFGRVQIENNSFDFKISAAFSSDKIIDCVFETISDDLTYFSNSSKNQQKFVSVSNDEKFEDDETIAKKRVKIFRDNLQENFYSNEFKSYVITQNHVTNNEQRSKRSFCLYILLQVFRI